MGNAHDYNYDAVRGFTPAAMAPRCDNSRTGAIIIMSAQGRHGGQAHVALLHSYQHLEFHINGKRNLQKQFF